MACVRELLFGGAGQLPPQALARFVVLAGAAPDAVQGWLSDPATAIDRLPPSALERSPADASWLHIDLDRAAALGEGLRDGTDPSALAAWLDGCWRTAFDTGAVRALITNGPGTLDTAWLTRLLHQHAPAEAVAFDHAGWRAWALDWPLKVGVPPSARGQALAPLLAAGWFRDLYDPLVVRGTEATDVLLFPGTLAEALRSARRSRHRRASAVILLGQDGPVPLDALRELAHHWEAALVAACGLAVAQWPRFWSELVAQLSHNLLLPAAVSEALRRTLPEDDPRAAVVLADLAYAAHNRPVDMALRLAHTLRQYSDLASLPMPQEIGATGAGDDIALALESGAPQWDWTAETLGASRLVRVRRTLEQRLGPIVLRHRPPRMEPAMAGMAPPDLPDPPRDEPAPRHVKFDLWPADGPGTATSPQVLQPDTDHRLEVFIAEHQVQAHATADTPLDESPLPPSADGHELNIVYCPLSPIGRVDGQPHTPAPAQASLHLPPRGTSSRACFVLRCGASVSDFRARLIVLHQQRVLQSLLLLPDAAGRVVLTVENRYAPGFVSPSADTPADMAFLINDNPDGASGLTAMSATRASFTAPDGLKQSIAQMRRILSGAVQEAAGHTALRLDRPELLDLMRQLANHGAMIVEELALQHPLQTLDTAQRIQVVEAVDQAYFPAEFLYSGPAPEPSAALCPNAAAALAGGDAIHHQCPHRDDETHVCPLSFWGMRKCIERHAPNGDEKITVSVPTPGQERLGPFGSALLAASDRAKEEMVGPAGLPAALAQQVADVTTVTSWSEWKAQVLSRPRDLLVLMPHSDQSSTFAGIPALEVSKDELAASNLNEKYVNTGAAHGPLVLLLGCSTSFADLPFLNFVRRFHLKGAPVVVGTLSVVHATQARDLAQRLLAAAMAPDAQALRLDEALLRVRRELMAAGNGVAFTLMAYGHSTWRL